MYNKGLKIINKKGKETNDKIAQKVIVRKRKQFFKFCKEL